MTKDLNRGYDAYWLRVSTGNSWRVLAESLSFGTGRGCLSAAKAYADNHNLPWPLQSYTKGAAIYKAHRIGMSWITISVKFNQSVRCIQSCAYKHAKRNGLSWPPREAKNE